MDGCAKSRPPTGIRSPDRPARSESLNRLSHPSPQTLTQKNWQSYSSVYFNLHGKRKYFGRAGGRAGRQAFPEFLRATSFDLLVSYPNIRELPNFTWLISSIYAILFIIRRQWPRVCGRSRAGIASSNPARGVLVPL